MFQGSDKQHLNDPGLGIIENITHVIFSGVCSPAQYCSKSAHFLFSLVWTQSYPSSVHPLEPCPEQIVTGRRELVRFYHVSETQFFRDRTNFVDPDHNFVGFLRSMSNFAAEVVHQNEDVLVYATPTKTHLSRASAFATGVRMSSRPSTL